VGNDDYTDVNIEGAHAAAPIWAEFMKKAVQLPQYSDTNGFTAPEGVEFVSIDSVSNLRSDASCPASFNAAFLAGTAPTESCEHATDHPAEHRNLLQKIFGLGKNGN
jgi:penicillin-binding protein 1B